MTLPSKILIDKICGIPIVAFLNLISLLLLHFKHKKEPDNSKIKRIAVCKFMGMGSIIESTPLLMTIRANFPEAEIVFITSSRNDALLSTFPFVDTIVTIDDRSAALLTATVTKALVRQWLKRIDVFIDLEVFSNFSTIIMALCVPRFTIGFYQRESHIHPGVYSTMIHYDTKSPVHDVYLQAAQLLKCTDLRNEPYDWKNIPKKADSHPASAGYCVVNPNASELRVERRWDRASYLALIERFLLEYPDMRVVLTGSPEEQAYVRVIHDGIKKEFRDRVTDSSGRLTLQELIALIGGCTLMITNDSGPMHIAFALKKNTVALFGPCSPIGYRATTHAAFVYKHVSCSPCVHDFAISPCKGNNLCMKLIAADDVMNAVKELLGSRTAWTAA